MSASDFISGLALLVSLWVAWLNFYHRKPKATVRILSHGSSGDVGADGAGDLVTDRWDITVCNVGKVPLVMTELSLVQRVLISINDRDAENAGLRVNPEEFPPTQIAVDDVMTFRITAPRRKDSPPDFDPNEDRLLSLSLMSSRGFGGLLMPVEELVNTIVVDDFKQ